MKFKVSMINDLYHFHDDTFIANNKKKAIRNLQLFNHKSKELEASLVYK